MWISDTCSKRVVMRRGMFNGCTKTAPFPFLAIVVALALAYVAANYRHLVYCSIHLAIQNQRFAISILKMSSTSAPRFNALSRDAAFWESQVSVYERFTGGCTRSIAAEIAETITPPITPASYILDNACGTGVFTDEVKARIPDAHIMAADISPGMAKKVADLATKRGWTHVETIVQDMRDLYKFVDETFSHVVTSFALVMLKEQDDLLKAAKEMYRVLQDGGVCVVTSWAGR